jgi:hypothetical protein
VKNGSRRRSSHEDYRGRLELGDEEAPDVWGPCVIARKREGEWVTWDYRPSGPCVFFSQFLFFS